MQGNFIEKYCHLKKNEENLIREVYEKMELSVRAYEKILKVARTIADLKEQENITTKELAEAVGYRVAQGRGIV